MGKVDIRMNKGIAFGHSKLGIGTRDILINIMGFMVGRVIVFGSLYPLGIAYFSACTYPGNNRLWVMVFVAAGMMTAGSTMTISKYLGIMLLIFVLHRYMHKKGYKQKKVGQALISMTVTFGVGIIVWLVKGIRSYDFIVTLLESIFVFAVTYIYSDALSICSQGTKRRMLSMEEMISITLLFGTVIAGIFEVSVYGIYLREVLSILLMLILGFIGGPMMGAGIGVIGGIILTLIGQTAAVSIGIFGAAAMIGGLFREIGRVGSMLGFILGQTILTLYIQGMPGNFEFLKPVLVSGFLFLVIPSSSLNFLKRFVCNAGTGGQEVRLKRVRDVTAEQLKAFSYSFRKLARTFTNLSKKKFELSQKDVSLLMDDVAAEVCSNCGLCALCWEHDFYNTYQAVFGILAAVDKKSKIEIKDVPADFVQKCLKLEQFIHTTNQIYELYKLNLKWHNRIVESRELVSQQLEGVASIIGNLAHQIYGEVTFKDELEEMIKVELDRQKMPFTDVVVIEKSSGKYEVTIEHVSCQGSRVCAKNMVPIVSKLLGRKMKLTHTGCVGVNDKHRCKIKLIEEQKYRIMTGIATQVKENSGISGDSYSFIELKEGQFLLALSDGMGSGSKANEESTAAIELLEEFMESGFDKDTAIRMINSVLVLKSNEESFSTLDMTIVDLYTGITEFIKIGCASTFIKRADHVEAIGSASLPVGILNNVDLEVTKNRLKDGDIIVMVTDGIVDSQKDMLEKEIWIKSALLEVDSNQPQYIADYILEKAKSNAEDEIKDDMTVLVARIWEKYA